MPKETGTATQEEAESSNWPDLSQLWLQVCIILASGYLVILAYPPFGFYPGVILGWTGFLVITFRVSSRSSFYLGLTFGIIIYAGTLNWLGNIFGVESIPLFAIIALFVALPALLTNLLVNRFSRPSTRALFTLSLFSAFEFFRCELFFLRFPWINAGSALGPNLLSPVVGVYGCSILIFAAAACLAIRETRTWGIGLSVILLGLPLLAPGAIKPEGPEKIRAAVVQGEGLGFGQYVRLSREALAESPDLIVWPEYALPYDIRKSMPHQVEELQELARTKDTTFIVGTKTKIGQGPREWRNTALVIDGSGVVGEYYKNRPVHFFIDGIAGEEADPVDTSAGRIGIQICFDCDYEAVTRELIDKGAEILVAPSFDATEWSQTQHDQHAAFFRIRAAESGRWLICAASSGYSRIIDPHGQVHEDLGFAETGTVAGDVIPGTGKTIYHRIGWLLPWVFMASALALTTTAKFKYRQQSAPQ